MWEQLAEVVKETLDASLSNQTRKEMAEAIRRDPSLLTYTRYDDGSVEVFFSEISLARVHELDLAPRPPRTRGGRGSPSRTRKLR